MPYLTRGTFHLYYEVCGQGRPIVFIHPPVMGQLTFIHQRPLADHFQLIFVDLVNSGKSTKRDDQTSVEEFAELIAELVKKVGVDPVIVCGYSNGGSVAQEFALRYPALTSGLILLGAYPEVSTYFLNTEHKIGMWAAENEWLPLFSYMLPKAHFRSKKDRLAMGHFIKQADGPTLKNIYENGRSYRSTDRLKQLAIPVLLVYGKRDFINQPYMVHFLQEVKELEMVLVPGVAHQVPTKRANECNAIIRNWISRKQLQLQ